MKDQLNRKEFLKAAGILSIGGLVLPSLLTSCSSSADEQENQDTTPTTSAQETSKVLNRHLNAWREGNIDKVMADWSDNGILINSSGIFIGKPAIREIYKKVFTEYFPDDIRAMVDLSKSQIQGEIAFTEWKGGIAKYAADVIIVRNGKKVAHTFSANYI
ncbi:nuclear transport factor 2 family protein [Chryseobacterium sp. B21-037]|uniref:nuclear transport factor 2 family protein n=1 Tax=Chryseobacterium sp. B21-037 TaxID=2926038 RepID=UPI00235A086A|nr:nuclear transport factor 2 family protein [Chryseobacterium sp. B21-037]MDC8107142.1 nuclear transport factor 2 family protein [Chryseobacterium sp. B21-037]WBV56337.1 nuclear transport factor 2 family protein [Chryseobacterium daecheongense]